MNKRSTNYIVSSLLSLDINAKEYFKNITIGIDNSDQASEKKRKLAKKTDE